MNSIKLLQQSAARQLLLTRASSQPLQIPNSSVRIQAQQIFRSSSRIPFQRQSRFIHLPRQIPKHTLSKTNSRLTNRLLQISRTFRRAYSDGAAAKTENLSLSQRLKKLSREYGWAALGVYLLLSAADFPFCFLAVRVIGADTIGHWEHVILGYIKDSLKYFSGAEADKEEAVEAAAEKVKETLPLGGQKRLLEEAHQEQQSLYSDDEVEDHGYNEAVKANTGSNASIWTQLALAYAIHKSFIFIRVPLTAAVTPKVVKILRGWGWNIGKMPSRKVSSATGVNTKGSGV